MNLKVARVKGTVTLSHSSTPRMNSVEVSVVCNLAALPLGSARGRLKSAQDDQVAVALVSIGVGESVYELSRLVHG